MHRTASSTPNASTVLQAARIPYSPGRDLGKVLSVSLNSCSSSLVLLGSLVLFGWFIHNQTLMAVLPGHVRMKPNAALCFIICGVALSLIRSRGSSARRWSGRLAYFVVGLAALTLVEYVWHLDLHIDQLLFADPFQFPYPGRMAPISAAAFVLAGTSLILSSGDQQRRRVSQALALLLTTVALTSIVGYLYGVPVLYGSYSNANTMALHTGLGFLVLGLGLILGDRESTIGGLFVGTDTASLLTRRLAPLVLMIPVLLGYLYLRPSINFGQLRFGMALFAVTLVLTGTVGLILVADFLRKLDSQRAEMVQSALESTLAVERSERELRLVTDNLPTLISYIDLHGRFLRVNQTYEVWHDRPADSIVGQTILGFLGNDYWERTRKARAIAAEGSTSTIETLYPTARGPRCALVTYAPDRDKLGSVRGFACMVIDVDDQRRAESSARQNEKLALVGRLSSSIAHEINNPVDAVMNLLYLAREQSESSEVRSMLETAEGELKRVANIAGQTLRFHKDLGRPELVLASDLFSSVLVLHRVRLLNARITVEIRNRAPQPFQCFEGQLRQVLNNLVANAVDAMQPGGRLLLRSRHTQDWKTGRCGVSLTVADTGIGMSEETRSRVFQAFFTTKGISGTGLGLWVSEEILSRHGGSIKIRSSTDDQHRGCVFVLFLPAALPAS